MDWEKYFISELERRTMIGSLEEAVDIATKYCLDERKFVEKVAFKIATETEWVSPFEILEDMIRKAVASDFSIPEEELKDLSLEGDKVSLGAETREKLFKLYLNSEKVSDTTETVIEEATGLGEVLKSATFVALLYNVDWNELLREVVRGLLEGRTVNPLSVVEEKVRSAISKVFPDVREEVKDLSLDSEGNLYMTRELEDKILELYEEKFREHTPPTKEENVVKKVVEKLRETPPENVVKFRI
jgi:hypothetical protein